MEAEMRADFTQSSAVPYTNRSEVRVRSGAWPSKCLLLVAVLAVVFGISPRTAWAEQRPADSGIGPNTIELHSDRIKFQIIPANAQPPAGFEQLGFDDTEFSVSSGSFGSGGACP